MERNNALRDCNYSTASHKSIDILVSRHDTGKKDSLRL